MKRDLDLIRQILLAIENDQQPLTIAGETVAQVGYHVQLLLDERYVEGKVLWSDAGEIRLPAAFFVKRITMAGHDYLDSVRDPKVWNKTKTLLEKVGGGAALEVVKDLAVRVMAEWLKP